MRSNGISIPFPATRGEIGKSYAKTEPWNNRCQQVGDVSPNGGLEWIVRGTILKMCQPRSSDLSKSAVDIVMTPLVGNLKTGANHANCWNPDNFIKWATHNDICLLEISAISRFIESELFHCDPRFLVESTGL